MDAMKDFITSIALRYYDSPKLEVNNSNSSNSALENFISDAQCLTLSALALNEKIQYQTEVSKGENASLIFYKSTPVTLENENAFQFVGITALPSNPVESLYLTLHHVYGPLLQSDTSITVDPKIQEMLSHLEAGLRTIASGKDGGPSLMVVLTVDDEADYWQTIFAESKTRKQRDMAEAFISILQPLAQEIRSIDIISTSEIQEAMESAGGFLDDLWRHSNYIYPQKRMAHLMDVIGNACITKLQEILTPLDIWGTDSTVIKILTECSSAASAWLSACYSLTQKYWPNHSLHAWEGQSHVPRYLNMFQERLKEIVDVRSIHLQLTKLLSASEQDDLKASKIFQPFHGLNIWQCTPKSNSNWSKSKSHFERLLKPAEDRIAEKLRPKLVSSSAKQMLHEFGRYMALIERPTVHAALKKEREIFMSALGTMLKEIETQVLEDKAPIDNEFNTQELSPLVQQIQWTKYMMGRVSEIEKTTDHLLNDLEGCALIKKQSLNLQNELRQMQTQLYEDWTRDLQMELNNKSLILSAESPVVEFSTDNNLMRVTFNPRLVSLERDVRHMSALGFGIPSAVREAVNHAAQFIGHARALQQVAAFHNTQGDRMIVSQRPMMLQAAIQLAALVKEQSAVPWKNIEAVSKYVEKLKDAESKLVEQNTYLTSQHNAMRNIVLTLMDTDLLQKQSDWKKKIREMRDIIEKVEARGFTNNRAWKIHWDIQLYKALEHQYRSTLINPLPHLPVVRVELLFRHQEVQLQPPLEELRANSYSQLRKLVSLPLHFIGLQSSPTDTESIFASIVKRNNRLIGGALEEVEKTLQTVVTSVQRWRKWGALGTVDLDSLCDIHLSDSADWDRNFKDCKAFGQAIAKLPMEDERVEWIWISSASLRSELEAHNRRYWFALTTSLQTSVQRDTNALETFIMSANKALTQIVPKNAKELATANEEFRDLKEKEPKMTALLEGLCKKQSMVRAWGGERTRPLEYLTKQWDNLTSHMQNHEQLIIHQAESVKSSLLGEWANLNETVEVWHSRWTQNKPRTDQFSDVTMLQLRHSYQLLADATHNWNTFKENKESMLNECSKFSLELDEKSLWTDIENKMLDDGKFWEPFTQFDEDLSSLSSQEWFLFQKKLHLLDDLVSDWSQKLEPYTAITLFIQKEINQYKEIVPSLKHLRGADFTERHWREIFSLLDIPPKPADTLILGDFLNVAGNIKINAKMLQKIWTSASHEAVVRGAIAELELWLAGARLLIVKHRDTKGQEVPIIKDYKDILAKVEEYQSLAGSARMAGGDSGGVNGDASGGGAGSDQLSIWETRLTYLHASLTSLAHVQRKWVYLEPILSGKDASSTVAGNDGGQAFLRLDADFRRVMRTVETDPRPSALVRLPALTPLLESLTKQLTRCQNTLEEYIAEKRTVFPRFFFLSDDDLLELLGQARANSQGREGVLQSHIKKLFPGCIGVHLGPGDVSITALKSHHDERLVLDSPVDIDVPVEIWLKCLEKQMRDSLRTCIKQCLSTSASQNRDTLTYPTQVLCLAQSIHFTEGTERAITAKGLHSMRESVRRELDNYIRADVQGEDENAERGKLQALVLQCNHHLAILDELISNGASSLDHWHWQKQLRFYHENKTEITAKMGLAKLPYTYEYLGTNTGTLVRTQLTDQCFLILTQALHLGQAGNPFGPAGTGKTESVKALGGLLGRLVLVFNCDEGMDKTTMGRLLSGLALSGSWGCFDEFNRLEEKTLSGIAQQFASLLGAISSDDSSIMATLNGKEVCVSTGCGVFVTMNPAGGGYGGRRRLPAALARNLRPAAMWSPRKEHIATALLAAHGYSPASTLADKIILCYNMASSLLSPMHHYDWGLRALKTVIGSCGAALRKTIKETKIFPLESQQMALVVESLKLNTLSKLSYEDSERFENLLKLIFPGVQILNAASDELTEALKESYKANNLTFNENQMQKCIEVYEQLKQRMGVVIVGPPGTGKSTVQLLLRHALNKLGRNVSQYTICPKAMNRTDLLGYIDPDTRQWNDGVISTTALAVSNQLTDVWCWVICDGDVDPEWIESLNSVLDDNRLLTLPSGWRIQFGENVNFIFETHNLSYASPATITRMGIISLSEEECCFKEVIQSWSVENNVSEEWKTYAIPFLQQSMSKVQEWSSGNMSEFIIPCHTISLVRQILSFLNDYKVNRSAEEQIAEALAKGLTCVVKQEAAESTLEQVSQWTGVSPHTLLWNDKSLLDSGWDTADETGPLLFSNRIQESLKVCQMWMDSGQHFMIVGPPASGKSLVLEHLLKEARDSTVINLQCTPVFNHQHIIQALKQKSALGSGGNKSGGRVILVVRSLQRAASDKWNTSLVQSFLLQLIQYGGFWENAESVGSEGGMRWLTLRSFLLIITASTGDTSFKPCPRFTNSVRLGTLAQPDEKELSLICGLNLGQVLRPLAKTSKEIQKIHETSLAMFAFYNEICNTFVLENHYKWTPRDLTLWCSNLKLYKITDFADIINVVYEEASCIFKDRLISIDERRVFDSISFKHLGITSTQDRCYIPKMTDKGFYMEPISSDDFGIMINKIISHCNTEAEAGGAFGEAGAEDCDEMRRLCAMVGRTCGSESGLAVAGSVGVGRRAAIKIAADILSATLYTIATPQQFNVQIKNILSGCGCDGVLTLLVLEEGAANDNNVLGCVEAILTGGLTSGGGAYHLPLSPRELEAFISQMKTTGGEPRTVESFVNNVRKHLGIIFLLDVKDANLKNLLETYRLLYQRCHFIWMNKWSDITLRKMPISIAKRLMIEKEIGLNTIPVDHIFDIYSSITDDELSTPYRYVMMLKTYFNIYQERKQLLEDKRIRLTAGVSALTEAQSEVTRLKSDAAKQQTALAEKQTKANQALNQIGVTMQSATLHKEEMQTLKKSTEIENAKLQERKKAIELELSEVEPAIQEARAAVGDIGTESLSEVRSLRAPPVPVRDVLEAVLRLMGIADTSWHSMKVFLSRRGIKEDIRTFDASNITRESLAAVEKLLIQRESSFQEKTARRASVACAPLAAWVLANVRYAHVLYKITPLEQEQRHLAKNLADAEAQMENLSSGLNTVDERVAALKGQLNTFTKEATEIEIKLTAAENTINKAEQLVLKLSDEFQRWQTNLQDLTTECEEISLRALLAAGFITYLANEDEGKRSGVIQQWCKIVGIGPQSFEIKQFLTTHDDEAQWTSDGLPSDSSAFHNAIIINEVLKESKCGLVPLIIDPNGGSIKWLLNHLAKTPKDVISQQSDKFNTSLQHAIRFGKVFIIEELTSIDDSWTSLLRGQIPCSVAGVNSINPAFRLVLCSRDTSLPMRLVPYQRALISIVDFTPQLQGLTDQLIYHAVKQEEPELQEELMQINSEKSRLQIQQTQLQVTLLSQLSSGDILQNAALLESLEKTQQASREIKEALQRAHQVSSAADLRCANYSSGASRAASSAIAVAALTAQHPRAALSLQTIIQLFLKALTSSKDSTIAGSDVSQNVVRTILERVLTALHKEHHCSVTLYLLHLIYPEHIPLQEWEVLISIPESQIGGKSEINIANEVPAWINDQRHPYVQMIKLCLPEIYTRLHLDDTNIWKKFSLTGDWENIPVEIGLTSFQKVIVVWATKPDKLYSSLMKAASQILGVNQLLPGGDLLAVVERWGSPEQPILVIGTEDNDPIDQIKTKAAHLVGIDNYRQVWLSAEDQQYEESIKETVEWARKCGGWAVVSVGVGAWPAAERVLLTRNHDINSKESHPRTRIWIVAEDGVSVPSLFATACINIVMEAPAGIRNNIIRTLSLWSPQSGNAQRSDGYGDGDPKRVRLEFSLGLVHSIIQERCSYIPQGWRRKYGFSWGDASAGRVAVCSASRATAGGLCATLYGGRVTCQRDSALTAALIAKHFDEEVAGHKWKPLGMDISLPMTRHLQDYMGVLSNFPITDSPAQLGLPNNIHRAKEQQAGTSVIVQLKSYSHGEASVLRDVKLLKKKLTPIFSLWKKINSGPTPLVKAKITDNKLKADGSGLTALLTQEWTAAVVAVKKVHTDLAALRNSTSLTDPIFKHIAEELIADQTPEIWIKYWPGGHRSASRFIVGLCHRAAEAQRNVSVNTAASQLPSLRLLLQPERVPFALRWEATLRLGVPPDRLVPVTTWGDGDADPTIAKIVLRDLWLEGAIWESGRLQPCRSDSPTPMQAPPISFKYVPAESINDRFKENIVEIPIYTSSDRIELVFNVGAPSADQFNTNLWLLNSTALIIP